MGSPASPSDSPAVKQSWTVPLNDLRRSWLASPEAQEVLCKVSASGIYSLGPQVAAFEEEFANYLGVGGVVGVASGTDALEIALRTVGCGRGDTIVSVANAGGYSAIAAAQIGARVHYCDVDPRSLLMSAETLDVVLTAEVKAVVVTHLYGNVVDMNPIVEMCAINRIPIVEDCAQATGATYHGKRVGSLGDIAAFSFYPTKNLGCMGDGGAVVTSNNHYASVARQLRQYGWTTRYEIDIDGGQNSRLDELQAALLRLGLRKLDQDNSVRQGIQSQYRDTLRRFGHDLVQGRDEDAGVGHLSVVLADSNQSRVDIRHNLASHGVQTAIHYPVPDTWQRGLTPSSLQTPLPITDDACQRIMTLPTNPYMSTEDVELVCSHLAANFQDVRERRENLKI